MSCSTPVVFIIFRRPDLTAQVFEAIRQAQPKKLLIVADGPRNGEETALCQQARAITENIDWNCEVIRNYSEVNLGCRDRVSTGLAWTFEKVEEAIILEDDCLPHPSFFHYCEVLLEKYRFDTRIMQIGGNNSLCTPIDLKDSYYFSGLVHIWGWATWKRSWKLFDPSIKNWPIIKNEYPEILDIFENPRKIKERIRTFDNVFEGKIDAWGYSWLFCVITQHGLSILPSVNLVSNIGFREDAAHTTNSNSPRSNLPNREIGFPLNHPNFVIRSRSADQKYLRLDKAKNSLKFINFVQNSSAFKVLKDFFSR
ncbi:glycosyltransferase family 2 protein [Nodosilinea sp. LEGE 07298]|uniref:glycosyltransferase family 2 protein n=1 Tax=Nodosilinea sp. LEGE 07298 TaxID=2777970 RepID=UPI001880E13F|nr:glycosyltransferase family 2 protein [Nodosilinea sp. LEGE 07298]MBE9109123.1 glycosyltransferase family 2 protein [Nodosilinea sp. LEGE 07298]